MIWLGIAIYLAIGAYVATRDLSDPAVRAYVINKAHQSNPAIKAWTDNTIICVHWWLGFLFAPAIILFYLPSRIFK